MTVQALEALEKANQTRIWIATGKRRVRDLPYREGLLEVARLVEVDDSWVGRMMVRQVLMVPCGMGVSKATRICRVAGLPVDALVGVLGDASRARLVVAIRGAAGRSRSARGSVA